MATNFPTGLDTLVNPSPTDDVSVVSHSDQHTNANDAIEALEVKVGINGSADTSSLDYKVTALETGSVMKSDYTPAHSLLVQQASTGSPTSVQIHNNTILGRLSGGGALIDALSASDVRTLLSIENVDNTSDANKPVSTAQATAIAAKQDTLVSGTNIKTINGSTILGSGNLVVSAGAGGSANQIQYNNAGALGGATRANITTEGDLNLTDVAYNAARPSTPVGSLTVYSRGRAGFCDPSFIDPSGRERYAQSSLIFSRVRSVSPIAGSTTFTAIGLVSPTATGTAASTSLTTTNFLSQLTRTVYTSTAAINSGAGARIGNSASLACFWRGNAAGLGGFRSVQDVGVVTFASTSALFMGFGSGLTAGISASVQPSTLTNVCFVGCDATDTNLQVMHNDNAGACTKVDLGASFPRPTGGQVYRVMFTAAPNASEIKYYVEILDGLGTGNKTEGTLSTNLPQNTVFFIQAFQATTLTGTAAVATAFVNNHLETNY